VGVSADSAEYRPDGDERRLLHDRSVAAVVVTGAVPDRYILHFDLAQVAASVSHTPAISRRVASAGVRGVRGLARAGTASLIARSPLAGVNNTLLGFHQAAQGILRSPAVWIGAVNGACAGAGLELSVFFGVDHGALPPGPGGARG
jgi:enoyl-CoA hydratase/carnithine racemase